MKNYLVLFTVLFVLPFTAIAEEITVAGAANVQFTLDELRGEFTKETGINVKIIIGSSGKLTAQIENGAPFDIFMSADVNYPQRLFKDSLTIEKPKVYAYGALVIWTLKDIDLSQGVFSFVSSNIKKIAIASPDVAPYGRQAVNAMNYNHLFPAIEAKLVYGESVSQVNQFITTEAVDAGVTAKSVVLAPNMKGKGKWVDVEPKSYEPIAQAVVILKYANSHISGVQKFYVFLFSKQAQEIFKKYGYFPINTLLN